MAYNNTARRGVRTTQTVDPMSQALPELSAQIRTLSPEAMPIISVLEKIGKGPAPKTKKVEVRKHYGFDHLDFISAVTVGTAAETRFANITVDQSSRPQTRGSMFYRPQDKIYIMATQQVVEVVMTEDAAYQVNGADISLTTGLTGNTATRSAPGTIVVRVVQPVNFTSFTTSHMLYLDRTIWESQTVGAESVQEETVFDYNFVEHKEAVIEVTEDQMNFVQMRGTMNDFSWQQTQMIERFKKSIAYSATFGDRAVNYDQNNRPTYHMRGLIPSIQTNVTVYDPTTTTDFETLVSEFMYKQAFRYNNGLKRKIAFAGGNFMNNFNKAFKEFRRSDFNQSKQTPGLQIESYHWMGYTIDLVRNELFRLDTPQSDWLCVMDPAQAELRVAKNFETWPYGGRVIGERNKKLVVEWQGTIAYHLEEHHALLRTA